LGIHNYALGLRKRPWKDLGARNWVPRAAGGGPRRNPTRPTAGLAGEGWGCGLLSPRAEFRGLDGSGQWPVRGSAAPGDGGCWELHSGEGVVRPGQQAAWAALVAREEGGREL
jgi:hypothetical protein